MESLSFALCAVLPVLLVTALGYVMRSKGIVTEEFSKQLSSAVYTLLLPMNIFKEIYHQQPESLDAGFILMVLCLLTAVAAALLFLAPRIFAHSPSRAAAIAQVIFRCNYTVIGLPLLQNMYSGAQLLPAYMVMPFTIAYFNAGSIFLLSLCGRRRDQPLHPLKVIWEAVTSPCVLAVLAAVAVTAAGIRLPAPLEKAVDLVGGTGSTMALIALGGTFHPQQALSHWKSTLSISLGRLVLLPACCLPIALLWGARGCALATVLFLMGTPSAASCYPVAEKMGADGTMTAEVVVSTHLLCGPILFLWIFALRALGLI